MGRVVSINVSAGGVPKGPVLHAMVAATGVSGDRQRNLRYHGGPDRAVCLYSEERMDALRAEGHPIAIGTTGENLTVSGLDWDRMVPGVRVRVGEQCLLELTAFAHPCQNIAPSFAEGAFSRMSQKTHPGWSRVYARVLREGPVLPGDTVTAAC